MASSSSSDQLEIRSIQASLSLYISRVISRANISMPGPLIWGPTNTPNIATLANEQNPSILDRIIFTNGSAYTLLVIEGSSSIIDLLLLNLMGRTGQPPASAASIAEMPNVVGIGECVICLDEFGGEMGREMPCKHVYHGECIEKWLNIHGTCPVCRYKMPAENGEQIGESREFWLSVSFDDFDDDDDYYDIEDIDDIDDIEEEEEDVGEDGDGVGDDGAAADDVDVVDDLDDDYFDDEFDELLDSD